MSEDLRVVVLSAKERACISVTFSQVLGKFDVGSIPEELREEAASYFKTCADLGKKLLEVEKQKP